MGEPIKAQRTAEHFAAATSPAVASMPFGSRPVPTTAAVSFATAELVAQRTYGNTSNLFLERSIAIDGNKIFKPVEFLVDNPVEGGFSTSHGHLGVISGPGVPTCPGIINCGVLPGPDARCGAEFEGLLEALAERMASEFLGGPFSFVRNYYSAEADAMATLAGEKGKGYWNALKSGAGAVWGGITSAASYLSENDLRTIASDAGSAVGSAYDSAVGFTTDMFEAIDELSSLTFDDIKKILKEWLRELLEDMACSARDVLAEMLADPKPVAAQMGEAVGSAKVHIAETAAVVLVTRGAGAGASKLGQMLGRAGNQMGDLHNRLKVAAAQRREPPGPSRQPAATPATTRPSNQSRRDNDRKEDDKDDKKEGDGVAGKANGEASETCLTCKLALVTNPVNVIYGAKLLNGQSELDFILEAPLPVVWQRTYASINPRSGWFGQGWNLPISVSLEVKSDSIDFIDTQGRRIRFPLLAVGERFFSKYEHITLQRNLRNQYEVISPDGLRLIFGLGEHQRASVALREEDEARQAEQAAANWQQLLDTQSAWSKDEPLPPRTPADPDKLPPQVDNLCLLGMIDTNHNHLRLHYRVDGTPHHLDTSSGRRLGFVFDRSKAQQPRLTHMVELFGEPDAQGQYRREQQQWLVEYRYNADGDLIEVRDGDGQLCRTFAWHNHMMVEHAEPGGLISSYQWDQYNPKGRVLVNTTNQGESTRLSYDIEKRQTTVTDTSGRQTLYEYGSNRYLCAVIDPLGGVTRYHHDAYGSLIRHTDPTGRITRYQYDALGNLTCIVQHDGSRYRIAWHSQWRQPTVVTDPLGRTTRYRYDERGNPIETHLANGAVTEYQYDGRGLVRKIIDAHSTSRVFEYDQQGRLLAHTDCSGNRTQYYYDPLGRLQRSIDPLGHSTDYQFSRINRQDRLTLIRHADGASERFAYDPLGRLIAHHDPLGRTTRYELDALGRPLRRIDALGHSLRYQYDVHGRLLRLYNQNNAVYRFAWDPLDRLIAEQDFEGRRINYRYDAAGHLIESNDGTGSEVIRTRYQRDALGRLLDKFSYKPGSRASLLQHAHSRYQYDAAGQLICARNRHSRIELYYDTVGQLTSEIIRSRGDQRSELQHTYDLLGNRETTILPDGRQLNLLRYGSGHVHQINLDHQLICDFERDALHRETGRSQGALHSHYQRDPIGRLLRSHSERSASQPTQAGQGTEPPSHGQRIARRYQYDAAGQLLSINDQRHGLTRYAYDPLGRLQSAQSGQQQEVFAFDPAHNLLQPGASSTTASPSLAGQAPLNDTDWQALVAANLDNPEFNLLNNPDATASDPDSWSVQRPNRLKVWEEHRYTYDAWGNCTEKRSGKHIHRYLQWDAEHQLSRIQISRQQDRFTHVEHWGYDYDPFGRRLSKYRVDPDNKERNRPWLDDQTTHYLWDGNRLLLERQGESQQLTVYEPESFVPLALVRSLATEQTTEQNASLPAEWRRIKEQHPQDWEVALAGMPRKLADGVRELEQPHRPGNSTAEIFYYHTDHLGTPREVTDVSGHIVWSATYKAWGRTARIERPPKWRIYNDGNAQREHWEEQNEPLEQNLRFQGQYHDQESGLHYNRFRYYDPDCGRYLSQDPIGLLGGSNTYQYAPNPVGWIDPLGLCKCPGESVGEKHGNSRQSTKEQHGYEILDTHNGTVCKTGVSGCTLNKNETSPRANSQANRWNREPGNEGRYEPRVVKKVPEGPGARQEILKWEQQNAERLRRELDPARHSRP